MHSDKHPTLGNGKICYLELPAENIQASAEFYHAVFGWETRERGDGALAFDDGVGEVSGIWTQRFTANAGPGILVYIMVDDMDTTLERIVANGGQIVQPVGMDAPEITARFSDPAGNILGVFQQ
ncbi:VOC family protein [Sediminibacterium soli]|uniref:VOC family protein n=1 Tax=Sediminibacterium soli TaxID=2698829 RepID=UPI00137942B5|nr:VOC family protein [Sediminibacterium soli]NCI45224.1 VOC family protein [Sediminibacterium soli]